jgi:hypothetical protein
MAMARAVKIDSGLLRSIIAEEMKRITEAGEEKLDMTQAAEFVAEALIRHLSEDIELIAGNAFELMLGTVGNDGVHVPGRMEDLDDFAATIADKVLKSEELKDIVERISVQVLRSAMEPS